MSAEGSEQASDSADTTAEQKPVDIQIIYAPTPDEQEDTSAAKEFALRAQAILDSDATETKSKPVTVKLIHLKDWDASVLQQQGTDYGDSLAPTMLLFLISSGPDGTVHRNVRKLSKALKDAAGGKEHVKYATVAMGLLGHSVCKTSAEQMSDQVFAAGRRLYKLLSLYHHCYPTETNEISLRLETQVELESPEDRFDEWVQSLQKSIDSLDAKEALRAE